MVKSKITYAGGSDAGRVRRNNEDAWYIDADRGVFLVVDGIGGQAAGEKAAEIAVDRIRTRLERQTGKTEERVREAIAMANNEILRAARQNPEWEGMACVLTLAVLDGNQAVIGHVGDSRLYELRGGGIRKVTHDHSPVGEREDNRELSEAEAMRHPRRNEVYRDVGSEEHAPDDPDFIELQHVVFAPDVALVLCSDGLSDQVPSNEIRLIVEKNAADPDTAVRALIDAANAAGGKDNVTVLVICGDQFAESIDPLPRAGFGFPGLERIAMFAIGAVVALTLAWFSRNIWNPPVVIKPQTLEVGSGAPYATIMEAMAKARAGDTIVVRVGEYREQVRLKSDITVRSRLPGEAILRASPSGEPAAVTADGINGARLIGFWIQGDQPAPLSAGIVLNNSNVSVEDTEISGAAVGVDIHGPGSPALLGNTIHDCAQAGIVVSGPSTPWISHNLVQRNAGGGLVARDGARPSLVGNVFERSRLELPPDQLEPVAGRNYLLDLKVNDRTRGPQTR